VSVLGGLGAVTTSPEPPIRIKTEDKSSHWISESSARGGGGIVGECDRCVKLVVLIGKRVNADCLSVMLRNVVAQNQFTVYGSRISPWLDQASVCLDQASACYSPPS